MSTYTIGEIGITRTASNINDADVFELQIKDGGSNNLKSAKITKLELQKIMNDGVTPLRYKALLSQNAPIASTLNVSMVAGQIWTLDIYSGLDMVDPFNGLELISGTIRVAGSKYRSNVDVSYIFTNTQMSYDGAPYIVSTDANGDFAPFVNTLGGNPTYGYVIGSYPFTLTGAFIKEKTYYKIGQQDNHNLFVINWIDVNTLNIVSGSNDLFYYTPFEIEVYP